MITPAIRSPLGVLALLGAAALLSSGVSAQPVPDAFTVVESGQRFATLQEAVNTIGQGRGTIRIAPGTYRQCAVQEGGVIVYEAPEPGSVTFTARSCEGKAAFVLRGIGAEIRGITFSNLRVADGNGAGIRLEKGALNVAYARFENSQQGILTADDPTGRITITRSTFTGLGTCENSAGCAHSIYIGHYVKARSREVRIENNSFDDANGKGTNYMIDLPAGSIGRIADNWFVQGRDKENYSAFIALGAEDLLHPSDGLEVASNEARFVPGLSRSSTFLADWTASRVVMQGNRIAGGIKQYEQR
jgi:hypothetical protein